MKTAAEKQPPKKQSSPEILNIFKYRGFRISEILNKKTKRREFKVRFQINKKEIYLTDERRKNLEEMIDEILVQERRSKYDLPTVKYAPALSELFEVHAPTFKGVPQRRLFERVAAVLISILPPGITITELKKAHFQKYIEIRLNQSGIQSKVPIKGQTVNRELNTIAAALTAAPLYFAALDDYRKMTIPKAKVHNARRDRTVEAGELFDLLAELRRSKLPSYHRIADDIEFRLETGLRRKEVARLTPDQFRAGESALRDVRRWKTGTVTKFFPLTRRACQIIESRLTEKADYIFTTKGQTSESDYRIISRICEKLGIKYGRYASGGFVLHDLRRNFASGIIQHTDIKTAQEFLGHSTMANTAVYLKTDERRMSQAIRRASGEDVKIEIVKLYKAVRRRRMTAKKFVAEIAKITGN